VVRKQVLEIGMYSPASETVPLRLLQNHKRVNQKRAAARGIVLPNRHRFLLADFPRLELFFCGVFNTTTEYRVREFEVRWRRCNECQQVNTFHI
jgi:hypothetical protein